MQREGLSPVVVHGGGKVITEWMAAQNVRPVFKNGLRVTDADSLQIVVAVLAGLINKELVAELSAIGGRALGLSGADGGMLTARVKDADLGYVGEVVSVDQTPIRSALGSGFIPVIAPVAVSSEVDPIHPNSLLNVNADTVAGEIACAMESERLLFLTDVPGVLDRGRRVVRRMTAGQARALANAGTVSGGMIPKIDACLRALSNGSISQIIDGRDPGALRRCLAGESFGTRIG